MTDARRDVYSHGHHDAVLRSHRWRTADNSAAYLLPLLKPTDRVLDVGVGPGTITVDLASRVPAGSVVGIDNAAPAVAATRELADRRGVSNVTLSVGDVYDLDFPDGHFDVVHAHQVLQHLSDPIAALREMRRVCSGGGIVAARDADYAAMTWYPESPALTRWLDLYRHLTRSNLGEPDAGRRLLTWAGAAGFDSVTSTASAWCFSDASDLTWWSETWAERLVASSIAEQAVDRGLSDRAELTSLAHGWQEWAKSPGAWFAILHGEILGRTADEPG
jgi:ubiquinone/menaquinone biosynthesis C-methylase UbiE